MTLRDCIDTALQSLRANVMRSALTALGIIIGVSAVISMVAIGAGAQQQVDSVIESMGANLIVVVNGSSRRGGVHGGSGTRPSLTGADAQAIENEIPGVLATAPEVRGNQQIIFGNTNWFTSIRGVTLNYFEVRDWTLADGRIFGVADVRSAAKVAILGESVVENLFPGQSPIGASVRINRVPFEVIGTLRSKGQTPFGSDQDDIVLVPLETAKRRVLGGRELGGGLVNSISVEARSADFVTDVEEQITELLRARHRIAEGGPDDFRIRNVAEFLAARAESSRVMAILLAAVASVSLLVGGIGIMNIMLVSVTERTREIGVRMAVGARGRDIRLQFLVEAVILALLGGILGIGLGIAGSQAIANFAEWPMRLAPAAIILAFGFSAAVGIFFGLYPANKAAGLDPIEALRHE